MQLASYTNSATEERERRDAHDGKLAQHIRDLEKAREEADQANKSALAHMNEVLQERQEAEDAKKIYFQIKATQMEEELAVLRAAALSTEDAKAQANALELRIAQQENGERQRRCEFESQLEARLAAAASKDQSIHELEQVTRVIYVTCMGKYTYVTRVIHRTHIMTNSVTRIMHHIHVMTHTHSDTCTMHELE